MKIHIHISIGEDPAMASFTTVEIEPKDKRNVIHDVCHFTVSDMLDDILHLDQLEVIPE